MSAPLWVPPASVRTRSRIGRYLAWLPADFGSYQALWEWSVTDLDGFWQSIWDYFEVIAHSPPSAVLASRSMPGARWFPGATLNYAENVLRMPGLAAGDPVVRAYSQTRAPVVVTAAGLRERVRRVRAGLKARGVGPGDRVVAYAPAIPETYVLLLAAASLGAVFSSCPPEFGARSVIDRWSQISPKVLVAVDGYRYGDKTIDRSADVSAIAAALPSLSSVVTIGYLDPAAGDFGALDGPDELAFEPVPVGHPLHVLFSSGTTGPPKAIVHGHGGILLEHLKSLALHHDLGPGDRFFWFTTTGWMMWNYLISAPAVGASIVMFDGDPAWPSLATLWDLVDTAGITYFGASAPFLTACRTAGLVPDKPALKAVGSTGAPLPAEVCAWVYEAVGSGLQVQSLSGGTDVCTGFVGAVPLLPVRAGVIPGRCLGARVEAYDPAGRPVTGERGELVITAPMPSMPVGFWNDPDGKRYREAYFGVYPGVWRHGDWISIAGDGSCVITGRSDATLNRGGVRLGTAEFYAVVDRIPGVLDSLVVHLDDGRDDLLLFVVLPAGRTLDDDLRARIRSGLRRSLSPRHVPDEIHQVRAVPRTLSAKRLEIPVKRILTGTPVDAVADRGSLADPAALTEFAAFGR